MTQNKTIEITRLPEFNKDLKKLAKRFGTIEADLDLFCRNVIYLYHVDEVKNPAIKRIAGLGVETSLYKAVRFACRGLGGGSQSGIRVIYAFFEGPPMRAELVEISYKGEMENQDRIRRRYG